MSLHEVCTFLLWLWGRFAVLSLDLSHVGCVFDSKPDEAGVLFLAITVHFSEWITPNDVTTSVLVSTCHGQRQRSQVVVIQYVRIPNLERKTTTLKCKQEHKLGLGLTKLSRLNFIKLWEQGLWWCKLCQDWQNPCFVWWSAPLLMLSRHSQLWTFPLECRHAGGHVNKLTNQFALILLIRLVYLGLKQSFHLTLWAMMHHHTKFGCQRCRNSNIN